jgi:hypothetical protein
VFVSAPLDSIPVVAFVPDQAPEAVQEVAFFEDQLSNDDPPLVTDVGFAAIDTATGRRARGFGFAALMCGRNSTARAGASAAACCAQVKSTTGQRARTTRENLLGMILSFLAS